MAIHFAGKHTTSRAGRPLGELTTQSTIYCLLFNEQECTEKYLN